MKKICLSVLTAVSAILLLASCNKSDDGIVGNVKGSYVGTASSPAYAADKSPVYFEIQRTTDDLAFVNVLDASDKSAGATIIFQANNVTVSGTNGSYVLSSKDLPNFASIKDGKITANFSVTVDEQAADVTFTGAKR